MADVTQTSLLVTLAQNYRDDVVRQINRQSVALRLFPFIEGEGRNVALVPEGSGMVAESFAEGADAANFGSDSQQAALIAWGMYRANFHVSGLATAASATSRTPLGNIQLWARNMKNASGALASLVNSEIYAGTGANKIQGLGEAIGSVSNTYAGIDRSDSANAHWRPYVANPGVATALTFDQIRIDLATIYVNSGQRPDLALVHPDVLRKLGGLFDPQKQYVMRTDVVPTRGERAAVTFEGGVGGVYFDGCWFVEDRDATNNRIHYVNSTVCAIEYLPLDLASIPGLDDEVLAMQADDGFGVTPLGMRLEMLAKTGDSDKAQMKTYLQLKVERPNACGTRINVATT